MSHQIAEVMPGLLIGPQHITSNMDLLESHGITHILSIGQQVPDIVGIKHTFFDAVDDPNFDMTEIIKDCIRIIDEERNTCGVVYVHCHQGVSRSATVVIAYLMKIKQIKYDEAYNILKQVRSCIQPNAGFVAQLKNLEKDLLSDGKI